MARFVGIKSQLPLALAALLLAAATGCTFEPPGSVLNDTVGLGADAAPSGGADAGLGGESTETLTLTFTSSPGGGDFAPANIMATWIEDSLGAYIATIDRKSGAQYVDKLVAWRRASGANNLDAVSGATRPNHNNPVVVTWEIPGNLANGIYTIRVETSDDNVKTPALGTFTFEKNGIASNTPRADADGYTGVTIDYAVVTP